MHALKGALSFAHQIKLGSHPTLGGGGLWSAPPLRAGRVSNGTASEKLPDTKTPDPVRRQQTQAAPLVAQKLKLNRHYKTILLAQSRIDPDMEATTTQPGPHGQQSLYGTLVGLFGGFVQLVYFLAGLFAGGSLVRLISKRCGALGTLK